MSNRARKRVTRQDGDEVFLDEDSDFDPELLDSSSDSDADLSSSTDDEVFHSNHDNIIASSASTSGASENISRREEGERSQNAFVMDDGWSCVDSQPDTVPFRGAPGIKVRLQQDSVPYEYFSSFIDDDITRIFLQETNRYARQCIAARESISPNSMFAKWRDVSPEEMMVFLGLTINMGLIWKPDIRSYWSTDPVMATPFFGRCMPRDRYLSILAFFHLVNNEERPENCLDKAFKVRPLFDILGDRFMAAYSPEQDLTIDESMVPWRGRLSFRMFIPSKPTRYGIKLYCVSEAASGYVCKMQMYTGAGPNGPEKNHSENVVKRLTLDFISLGHTLYMDSFYSSPALFEHLRERDTMAVGTVRPGRAGMPKSIHHKHTKLKKGESLFRRRDSVLCFRHKDRRDVYLLSTKHTANMVTVVTNRRGQTVTKPTLIHEYNTHKKGVDQFGQNLTYYSFNRKTIKWWKRTAMHLIHLAKVQSFILYRMNARTPKSQYDFTVTLVKHLAEIMPRLNRPRPRMAQHPERLAQLTGRHFMRKIPATDKKQAPQRICCVCSFRDDSGQKRYKRRKDTRFECVACDLGMCPDICFRVYHSRVDFKAAIINELNLEV